MDYEKIVIQTEEWVKKIMENYDSSHDFNHAIRVKNLALKIADSEGIKSNDKYITILAALTHDIADSKYSVINNEQEILLNDFFKDKLPKNIINKIIYIAKNTSLSKELVSESEIDNSNIMLKCVQDADRIESLGSIGIARYFIYGIIKNKSNMDDIFSNIRNRSKLLIKYIKTNMGKKIAKKKYKIIKTFLKDYYNT